MPHCALFITLEGSETITFLLFIFTHTFTAYSTPLQKEQRKRKEKKKDDESDSPFILRVLPVFGDIKELIEG